MPKRLTADEKRMLEQAAAIEARFKVYTGTHPQDYRCRHCCRSIVLYHGDVFPVGDSECEHEWGKVASELDRDGRALVNGIVNSIAEGTKP